MAQMIDQIIDKNPPVEAINGRDCLAKASRQRPLALNAVASRKLQRHLLRASQYVIFLMLKHSHLGLALSRR